MSWKQLGNLGCHLGVGQLLSSVFNHPVSLRLAVEFLHVLYPNRDCNTRQLHILRKDQLVLGNFFEVQRWKIHSNAKAYQIITASEYNYSSWNSAIKRQDDSERVNTLAWNLNPSNFFSSDYINRFPFLSPPSSHAWTSSQICCSLMPIERASLMLLCRLKLNSFVSLLFTCLWSFTLGTLREVTVKTWCKSLFLCCIRSKPTSY